MKELLYIFWEAFKRLLQDLADPFISVAVMIDESKRLNLDGSWDKYWERKNRRAAKRAERRARK